MINPEKVLSTLDSLNELARDVDFTTFANLSLYTLIIAAEAIQSMPPAIQMQLKHNITSIVNDSTGSVSEVDNSAAFKMLERLGLYSWPDKSDYLAYVEAEKN